MSSREMAMLFAFGAALATLPACGDDDVLIRGLTFADESCQYPVQPADQELLPEGIIDISFPGVRYFSGVQIRNTGGDPLTPQRASLRLRAPDELNTGAAFGEYEWVTEIAGNLVPEDGKASGGLGVVVAELIPAYVVSNMVAVDPSAPITSEDPHARTLLDITIDFETPGGDLVESSQFSFPLEICYGCLNGFPGRDASAGCGSLGPGCATAGNLCSPGQDQVTKCACP